MLVCLCGYPNSGKTTILNKINKQFNCFIFNTDQFINQIYQANNIGYELIKTHFGQQYVDNKCVNKNLLRELVINNQTAYKKLNDLIWPLIKNKLYELKDSYKDQIMVVELAIYLLNSDYFCDLFDYVIYIDNKIDQTNPFIAEFLKNKKRINFNLVINNYPFDSINNTCKIIHFLNSKK